MGNWDNLSLTEKAAMMRVAVKNGITNLQDIKREYNEFAEGGDTDWSYNGWKKQISEYMGIKPDEDNTYDYEAFFNKYPEEAWKMLNGDPTAHFPDEFKTVYHPTFSSKSIGNDGSIYSGVRNPKTNPKGLTGGTWSPDYKVFTMSPDGYRGPVSMDDRKWYLENAEDNGVQLREADGSLPIYDGIPWGGVLPNVTIYGNKFVKGGPKKRPSVNSNAQRAMDYFMNKGLSQHQAAGLVGNLMRESGMSPTAVNSSSGAYGLAQWLGSRKKALFNKYGNNPTLNQQLDFVWNELNSTHKKGLKALKSSKSAEEAARNAMGYYEFMAGPDAAVREMRKYGQDGEGSMRKGINYASILMGHSPSKSPIVPITPTTPINPSISQESLESPIPFTPFNPEAFFATPDTYQQPIVVEESEAQKPVAISSYSPEEIERQERMNRLSAFNRILSLTNPYPQEEDSFLSTIGLLTGNTFSKGGKIYIKPSHRGRLTELKKRTGKSEAELYKTGGPAVRKMITFARNSRKWKHGLGGNLYDDGGSYSYTKPLDNVYIDSEGNVLDPSVPSARGSIRTPDVIVTANPIDVGRGKAARLYNDYGIASNDATSTPLTRNIHLNERGLDGATKAAAWMKDNPTLNTVGMTLGATPFAVAGYPAFMAAGEGAATALANPYVDAAITSAFAGHGLNHAINEGIDGWGDAAMTALEVTPLGRLAKPMWNAGKEGLQYAAKAADNATRYMSPSYDLYRTIGETTPRTTPTYHDFRLNGEQAYTGSPLFEFGQTIGTSSEKAYFMRAPKDVDVLKLGNGKFRHEVVGNNILPSGEVNGKFVSYGEPWQEFALGENSALYEFPVGPRRGPSLMATDWKGRPQKYSVDEVYDYMQQEEALRNELASIGETMGDDFLKQYSTIRRNLINEKYPALKEHIDTSVYGANQTVIPNERWNFDKFLKTPFWKYSENPLSGQVQKELMMGWPEAKHLETPTIEWTDAVKTPQITAENAAGIQYQIEQNVPSGSLEETAKSVDKGRNTLLDWIRSPFYKARLEDEPLYRVADDVVADAGKMIEEVPVDISKTKLELDPSGRINGVTKTRPAIQTQLPDGTTIVDLNTGLDVNVASDLGKDADETTLHELLHYMTANSKGTPISKAGEKIIEKGWMNPTETHFDAINIIHKNRSKGWQDYILDQNNALLPQYDSIVKMVMEEPNKAISFLEKAGKNTQDAQKAIQSLRSRYSTWYDIQEQRAYLQQLFHSKIRPNIKNPNDATEIEEYLSSHPEILENFPAYKHIQEVRPGSLKDYAKYFSAALGTIPFIFKTPSKDE